MSSASYPDPASRHRTYSRKQKSLGLLCSNFLNLYDRDDVESVGLDEAANKLGVERRRIYDIVNVLESVGVLARKAKNRYSWKGFVGIPKALQELKEEAIRENFCFTLGNSCNYTKVCESDDDEKPSIERIRENVHEQWSSKDSSPSDISSKKQIDNRREKSLGLLTQNFVKLFLCTNADMVSLDEAARLLLGDASNSAQMRTKVRRLYDIANVLSSLNLIEKTHQTDSRKPAFRWLGLKGNPESDLVPCDKILNVRQANDREFGTDITNIDSRRTKVVSPIDEKAIKVPTNCEANIQYDPMQQGKGSRGYVYGPFRPVSLTEATDKEKEKSRKRVHDWDNLTSAFRPRYHNQALTELFAHYMEAWKSWYVEVAQGTKHKAHLAIH
ncbi:E2F transcription factor-like E2FE isoform X2 [Aristolochia californica]|uniref:E2F transcription factor-like E2FE isoform X2 n=1 Tax=Aristolochia californica TaxID=171875 RepID=UPI0035DF74F3